MVIDHIGIVVPNLEDGIQQWKDSFGYQQLSAVVTNSRQKVRVVFMTKDGSVLTKLVEPSDPTSPVSQLAKRGGGLHHLCFRCEDMKRELSQLVRRGARILTHPQPGEAFNNNNIAFLFLKNNLNIEIIDTAEKAHLL